MSKVLVASGGEDPGELELMTTTSVIARSYADQELQHHQNCSVGDHLPDFLANYKRARNKARNADALRKTMPVLNEGDLPEIKRLLAQLQSKAELFCDKLVCSPAALIPVQRQIYFDKSMNGIAEHGVLDTLSWLRTRHTFTSLEGKILDGHHGWLSGMLIHPEKTQMLQFRIFKPLREVLPLLRQFSDQHGRVRNA